VGVIFKGKTAFIEAIDRCELKSNAPPPHHQGEPMVKILEVDQRAPVIKVIAEAAATIRAGGLVVYPTETVYGLGADACSDEAVAKVFTTKVRPIEDPISIAVSSLEMARQFTQLTPRAEVIFKKFLPGPLTVILEAKPIESASSAEIFLIEY